MAAIPNAAVDRPNEGNFEPAAEWTSEEALDTLMVYVPGFKKDNLKVQLTSTGKVRISGERQGTTGGKSQFQKEFPIPPNCNTNKVSANFVEGIIYVKLPKTKTPPTPAPAPDPAVKAQEKPKPVAETPPPPPAKLPKPTTTTTTTTDPQLKNNTDNNKIAQQQQGPSKQPSKAQTTKDQTGDAIIAQQQKPPSQKEKQQSKEVENKKNGESKDLDSKKSADNIARNNVVDEIKTVEKEKNNKLLVEEKKSSTGGGKAERIDESLGKLAAEKAAKTDERGKTVDGGGETGHHGKGSSSSNIAEAGGITGDACRLEGVVAVLKKTRRFMNLAVALLFVVVFILYAKDAIFKSFKGESKRSAEL